MSVSDDDPRPRYTQVADDLRRSISQGELSPGQRLRPSRELAKEYGVALMTFQRAVELLKAENVLVGVPGRGTFVRTDVPETQPESGAGAEYAEIMEQIAQLRLSVRTQMGELDQRVSQLEEALRPHLDAPQDS